MKAEDLYARASAQGVDLGKRGRITAKERRVARERVKKRLGLTSVQLIDPDSDDAPRGLRSSALGKSSTLIASREWTIAELGQAAQGVPEIAFAAACFAYAGAHKYLWRLHGALLHEAMLMQRREEWPEKVIDVHGLKIYYLEQLCMLVLDDDRHGYLRNWANIIDQVYAIYMCVPDRVWKRDLGWRFQKLQFVWHDWLGTAGSIMQPRLDVGKS